MFINRNNTPSHYMFYQRHKQEMDIKWIIENAYECWNLTLLCNMNCVWSISWAHECMRTDIANICNKCFLRFVQWIFLDRSRRVFWEVGQHLELLAGLVRSVRGVTCGSASVGIGMYKRAFIEVCERAYPLNLDIFK